MIDFNRRQRVERQLFIDFSIKKCVMETAMMTLFFFDTGESVRELSVIAKWELKDECTSTSV